MRKSILMTGLTVIVALFCTTCYDGGTDSGSDRWAGDVDRFLRGLDGTPSTVTNYKVTISGGGTDATGAGDYAVGDSVAIFAGYAPTGKQFKNWTTSSNGVTFVNENSARTKFKMPANAVTVTANFEAQSSTSVDSGSFTDSRGVTTKTYKWVKIGGVKWMAENLNYDTLNSTDSWCYNNQDSYCVEYGRLYNWNTAKTVCPTGWHLPDTAEWRRLVETAGGIRTAGSKLKSSSGWDSYSGIGSTDEFQFSALPGGYRLSSGSFGGAGFSGRWWAATGSNAYRRDVNYNSDTMNEYSSEKDVGYSVRCVMDDVR